MNYVTLAPQARPSGKIVNYSLVLVPCPIVWSLVSGHLWWIQAVEGWNLGQASWSARAWSENWGLGSTQLQQDQCWGQGEGQFHHRVVSWIQVNNLQIFINSQWCTSAECFVNGKALNHVIDNVCRFNLDGDIAATWSCPKWGGL